VNRTMFRAMRNDAILVFALISSSLVSGRPLIEKLDDAEINWSELSLRAYGVAKAADQGEVLYRNQELQAREVAANVLVDRFKEAIFSANSSSSLETPKKPVLSNALIQRSASFQTVYFASGAVKVGFEVPIPKVLKEAGALHPSSGQDELEVPPNTGIVFKVPRGTQPSAVFSIVTPEGKQLFSITDVSAEAISQRLMGRWFIHATKQEIEENAGNDPVTMQLTSNKPGQFSVNEDEWRRLIEPNRHHLRHAKIILDMAK
jgi:hypothetical protein